MNDELESIDTFETQNGGGSKKVPNSTAVLVLGILSIVTCWLYGIIGLILGIIAIVLHKKDKALYQTNPSSYAESFKNSKAGFVCAIIGVSLSALFVIYLIVVFGFIATYATNNSFR